MPKLQFEDLGLCDYEKAHSIQKNHFDRLIAAKKNKLEMEDAGILLLCEHPPVYTIGRNGSESNLISSKDQLNAQVHRIGRGGDITFHGPGQIVGYPILNLEMWPMGLSSYVERLEEVIIQTLKIYGVTGQRTTAAPGVWLDCGSPNERKICALGIQASRWVTMHGFAFNVNTNLDYFNNIIPCGLVDKGVTSLEQELGHAIDMQEIKQHLKQQFESIFELNWKLAEGTV